MPARDEFGPATGLAVRLLHKAVLLISVREGCHLQVSVREKLRTELGVQFGGKTLRGETKERWRELCERVVVEQDPARLVATIQELLQELEGEEERRRKTPGPGRITQ